MPARRRLIRCGFFVLIGGLLAAPGGLVCVSQKVDLGTLGGDESIAAAINAAQVVVGGGETADGKWHAFLYQDGVMTDLGTLGGDSSEAHDINVHGMVVGTSEMPDPCDPCRVLERAFLWQDGAMTDLGTFAYSKISEGWAISDAGKVVGTFWSCVTYSFQAFLWADGAMTDLGTLGGYGSCALDINNADQIVGWSMVPAEAPDDPNDPDPPPVRRAFLWTAGGGMSDLGTLGGRNSSAYAVNEDGYVTGWSDTADGERHVFLWHASTGIQDLGTLGGPIAEAWGIGSGGVVGYSLDANDALQGMWWWHSGDAWPFGQPLGGDGPVFVHGLRDGFRAVGSARTPEGHERAFLRTDVELIKEVP